MIEAIIIASLTVIAVCLLVVFAAARLILKDVLDPDDRGYEDQKPATFI